MFLKLECRRSAMLYKSLSYYVWAADSLQMQRLTFSISTGKWDVIVLFVEL